MVRCSNIQKKGKKRKENRTCSSCDKHTYWILRHCRSLHLPKITKRRSRSVLRNKEKMETRLQPVKTTRKRRRRGIAGRVTSRVSSSLTQPGKSPEELDGAARERQPVPKKEKRK
jgi:hypothetical protein